MLRKLSRMFLVFTICSAACLAESFQSGIGAQATFPEQVDGKIVYKTFSNPPQSQPKRVHNCVLLHGHGITQRVLEMLQTTLPGGKAIPKLQAPIGNFLPGGIRELSKMDFVGFLAKVYFSEELIRGLLAEACDNVIVPFQESTQTTHLELVYRLERFLKRVVCTQPNQGKQWGCGVVGHSKLGGVVTSIARRCMERTSELGVKGCGYLGKVYSSAGVLQGVGATAVLSGGVIFKDRYENNKESYDKAFKLFDGVMNASAQIEEGLKKIKRLEGLQDVAGIDFLGPYEKGRTNPTWFDLSPLTPLEKGVPLALVNRKLVLQKAGWFQGQYAASATDFDFQNPEGELDCLGKKDQPVRFLLNFLQAIRHEVCQHAKPEIDELHEKKNQTIFAEGIRALEKVAKDEGLTDADGKTDFIRRAISWDRFSHSDGMVDYLQALDVCTRSQKLHPETVRSCTTFPDTYHLDFSGASPVVAKDMIEFLKM